MVCTTCGSTASGSRRGVFAALSRAAAKSAAARLRRLGVLPARVDWAARAAVCERCPLRVIAGGTSYCGTPFLRRVDRDPALDGCGCPTVAKSKDPAEHCPVNGRYEAARSDGHGGACECKWCFGAQGPNVETRMTNE
jgi:hypothetical protein